MFRKEIRTLTVTLIIVLVLIGLSYSYEILTRPKEVSIKDLGYELSAVKKTSEFEIRQGEKVKLSFRKSRGSWIVNGKTADSEKVRNFLESLSSMIVESELGEVKGKERDFSLDRLSRYEVSVKLGNKVQTLYFGKVGPVIHSRYLLGRDGKRVFLVSGSFADDLSLGLNDWREKKLIILNGVSRISVETTSSSFEIAFKPSEAVISSKGKKLRVTEGELERLKLDLEGVRADDFVDSPDNNTRAYLEKPEITVSIEGETGKKTLIRFARKDQDYFIAEKEGVSWLFLIPYFNLDVFTQDPIENYGGEKI
jgi:hypothetical protein